MGVVSVVLLSVLLVPVSLAEAARMANRSVAEWEAKANAGADLALEAPWDSAFVKEWLLLAPQLADLDLRGALYVSREHAPLITPEDRLSSEAAELLLALLEHPDMASLLKDRLVAVPRVETAVMMDRLLAKARQEQEWGVPDILEACLTLSNVDPAQGARIAAFLRERPPAQIRANIIPKIGEQPWASALMDYWLTAAVSPPVKAAINVKRGG